MRLKSLAVGFVQEGLVILALVETSESPCQRPKHVCQSARPVLARIIAIKPHLHRSLSKAVDSRLMARGADRIGTQFLHDRQVSTSRRTPLSLLQEHQQGKQRLWR